MYLERCNLTHVSKKTLGQCYKTLEQAFNLSPGATAQHTNDSSPTIGPEKLFVRYCNLSTCNPFSVILLPLHENTAFQTGGVQYLLQEGPSTLLVIYWAYKTDPGYQCSGGSERGDDQVGILFAARIICFTSYSPHMIAASGLPRFVSSILARDLKTIQNTFTDCVISLHRQTKASREGSRSLSTCCH